MANNYLLFKGKEAVLRAYNFNKVPAWAIVVGKDPMFSYDGSDMVEGAALLEQVIEDLIDNNMQGTLQLRVYRDVSRGGILNNTPFNYGFRFQLYGDEEYNNERLPQNTVLRRIMDRLDKIEGGEETEEDNSVAGQIAGFLKRPEVMQQIFGRVLGFVDGLGLFKNKPAGPAAMSGVMNMGQTTPGGQAPPTTEELYKRLSPDEQMRFNQATYVLMFLDPAVGTNLLKLATLLQNKPDTYEMLTKMSM